MTWKAGFAEINITPPLGISLSGIYTDRKAKRICSPLFVKAMVLDNGLEIVGVVICDLLALKRSTVLKARALAGKLAGIPEKNILIAATHTHFGPATTDLFQVKSDPGYLDFLIRQITAALLSARNNCQEVTLKSSRGEVENLSFNRRYIMKDGHSITSWFVKMEQINPQAGKPEGPVDQEVNLLYANEISGKTSGLFVNFGCHPWEGRTIPLDSISSDYPGYLSANIKQHLGEDTVVLFGNGSCGNIEHYDYGQPSPKGPNLSRRAGTILALASLKIMAGGGGDLISGSRLESKSKILEIPIRPITSQQVEEAKKALSKKSSPADLFGLNHSKFFAAQLLDIAAERNKKSTVDAEIQAIRIGNMAMVGLPGEIFAEFGLEIKHKGKKFFNHIMVIELANGVVGYIPTPLAFKKSFMPLNSYETTFGHHSKLVPEAGEMMVKTSLQLLEELS